MLKRIILSCVAAGVFLSAEAQSLITLTQNNISLKARNVNVNAISTANLPVIDTGGSQTWDFSNLTVLGADVFEYSNSTNTQISNTAIVETLQEPVVASRYLEYKRYWDFNSNGLFVPGISADYQSYPIGDLTGNSKDTFYVPLQTQVYKTPQYTLKFPATHPTLWTNINRRVINFELTISNFGLNKTPGSKVSDIIVRNWTDGWGKLRLPVDTLKSKWYDVLLVNTGMRQSDSFYMNGNPAPDLLLTTFGLKQNKVTEEYRTYFYREGDFFPLMYISYGSDNTRKNPVFAYYTTDNVTVTGIKENALNAEPNLYPNPISGNENLHISFQKDDNKSWQLNVVNVLGQLITQQQVNETAGKVNAEVEMAGKVKSGIYFVQLKDANGILRGSSKVIVR